MLWPMDPHSSATYSSDDEGSDVQDQATEAPERAIATKLRELEIFVREAANSNRDDQARSGALNLIAVLLRQPLEVVDNLLVGEG